MKKYINRNYKIYNTYEFIFALKKKGFKHNISNNTMYNNTFTIYLDNIVNFEETLNYINKKNKKNKIKNILLYKQHILIVIEMLLIFLLIYLYLLYTHRI